MRKGQPASALLGLLLGVILVWLVRQWVWMPVLVVGNSMEPALRHGQLTGVNKLAYASSPPRRGEVVAVWTGEDVVVKRIVGLPGEEIGVRNGVFYINGVPLREPYVELQDLSEIASSRTGSACFVIAGDNRSETFIAVVHRSRILGRIAGAHNPCRAE